MKYILFVLLGISMMGKAQETRFGSITVDDWHLADKEEDGYYGISLKKAYRFIKSNKLKSNPVIVAVIDTGIDTLHEDLKSRLWHNSKEIPRNEIDDDANGYIDDVYGWNFLGNTSGRNVIEDTYEYIRQYYALQDKYKYAFSEDVTDKEEHRAWQLANEQMLAVARQHRDTAGLLRYLTRLYMYDSLMQSLLKKSVYTATDVQAFKPQSGLQDTTKLYIGDLFRLAGFQGQNNEQVLCDFDKNVRSTLIMNRALYYEPVWIRKEIIGDNVNSINDHRYGNGDINEKTTRHGTHVAGIIAAQRDNRTGVQGIANNARIMVLRVVPAIGDEYDKDVALAIFYAVDNGARIINLSLGKSLSPNKHIVDSAVKYAARKNVLIVHAAGNEYKNLEKSPNYPSARFMGQMGDKATNWIEVGASSEPLIDTSTSTLIASFSNYGKGVVDVFAPGSIIYSCLPKSSYGFESGTSMAAPVVTGIAALLLEYFPFLNATELKEIIEATVIKPKKNGKVPETNMTIDFSELCKSGGIVNAYNAVKYAFKAYRR